MHRAPPRLIPGAVALWKAWRVLERSRQVGEAIGAIPVSEVYAYCSLLGIDNLNARDELLTAIQHLDGLFLVHLMEKREEEEEKRQESTPHRKRAPRRKRKAA